MGSIPKDAPSPRLCLMVKTSPSQEYGYNLHAERGKAQFIGTVDAGSIAERAGIEPGDRIFAVNGKSIIGENHKKVVERIKENPMQCELLVISEAGAEWYKSNNLTITPSLPNIIRPKTGYLSEKEGTLSCKAPPTGSQSNMSKGSKPRLCHLVKPEPDVEFGFNLHAEKNRGHFIGVVDSGSIGDRAGLETGQRIVGVNGTLIYPTTAHKDVVALIKKDPLRTDLLVASEDVDKWHKESNTPYSFDDYETFSSLHNDVTNVSSGRSSRSSVGVGNGQNSRSSGNNAIPVLDYHSSRNTPFEEKVNHSQTAVQRDDGDIFKLTAAEARQRLVHRKKDPRRDVDMTLQEKYRLVTNL